MAVRSGTAGEDYACGMIEARGGQILCRNYTARGGEIDIVAREGRYLVFAEVKLRAAAALGSPLESVTPAKQRRLIRTAVQFMMAHPSELQPRFDVVALTTDGCTGEIIRAEYIENAFDGGGSYAAF